MRPFLVIALLLALPIHAASTSRVATRMQNIVFHLDKGVELRVDTLSGHLVSVRAGKPPVFDDVGSYVVEVDSARVSMTPESLTSLLNNVVFADRSAPIRNLKVEIEGSELKQTGVLRKGVDVPFTMRARIEAAPDGRVRLHPVSMKAAGFVPKRVLDFFGLDLQRLVKLQPESAVKIEGNDLLLDPERLLPPPRIRGKVTRAWIANGLVVQQFGPEKPVHPLALPDSRFPNYMYYRGGSLRFGKLTMTDTDLMLVDDDPRDPFDFSPSQYDEQLMAGYSKNTAAHGLITHMPDLNKLGSRGSQGSQGSQGSKGSKGSRSDRY
jgi:hypothetical protein